MCMSISSITVEGPEGCHNINSNGWKITIILEAAKYGIQKLLAKEQGGPRSACGVLEDQASVVCTR